MRIREIVAEAAERTGLGDTAVVGWGRGMGHRGHMMLASSVITHARDLGADPYFFVSRTVGRDDPITPEEKLEIYRRVFPQSQNIFYTATDDMPDLTRVLTHLNRDLGYRKAVVVVGADQRDKLSYVKNYNGKPNKAGQVPFDFDQLDVIARQETSDPSREEEGPRATPMRDILKDPAASDEERFRVWRAAMSPELSDEEVRDLMNKAAGRMAEFDKSKSKTNESLRSGEYYLFQVTTDDGQTHQMPFRSDEGFQEHFENYWAKRGRQVISIKTDWSIQGFRGL
jgi:chemotaxis regulatin CheY-phosphate phosphatase CheZ